MKRGVIEMEPLGRREGGGEGGGGKNLKAKFQAERKVGKETPKQLKSYALNPNRYSV